MHDQFLILGEALTQWLMAASGVAALFVSAWAVWLVRATLHETRRAVTSADEATTVARDIGRAQVRAYITVEPGELHDLEIDKSPYVQVKIYNKGQSPALGVVSVDLLALRPYPVTELNFSPINGPELKGGAVIPPGTNIGGDLIYKKVFTGQHMEGIISGEIRLMLVGFIKYLDVFKVEHTTKYCYTLSVSKLKENDLYRTKWDLEKVHNEMT